MQYYGHHDVISMPCERGVGCEQMAVILLFHECLSIAVETYGLCHHDVFACAIGLPDVCLVLMSVLVADRCGYSLGTQHWPGCCPCAAVACSP
jgi:hypothetical protein